tara:strand:+ start:146 stop:310 length:165 start_codon:yes stop_codon:yes gene_type:complete
MIDAAYTKAHRRAASLLNKGDLPDDDPSEHHSIRIAARLKVYGLVRDMPMAVDK